MTLDNDFEEEWDRFKRNSLQKHYKIGELRLICEWFFNRGRLIELFRQNNIEPKNKKKS